MCAGEDLKNKAWEEISKENYSKASELMGKYIESNPDDCDAIMINARVFKALNQPEKAIDCCKKTLVVDDKYIDAYYGLGIILLEIGEFQEGLDYLNTGLNIEPDNEFLLILKATALASLGKVPEAFLCLNKAKEIDPNNPLIQRISEAGFFSNNVFVNGLDDMDFNYDEIFNDDGTNYFKKFNSDELDLAIDHLENIKMNYSKKYNLPFRISDVLTDYQNSLNSFLNCFCFYKTLGVPLELETDYKFTSPQYFHDYMLLFTFLKIIDALLDSDRNFTDILIKNSSKWNLKSLVYSHLIFDDLDEINNELYRNFKNYIGGFDKKIQDILNGFSLNSILDFLNENNLLLNFAIGVYIVDLNEIILKSSNNLQKFYFSFIKNFRYNKFFYSEGYNEIFKLSERPNFTLSLLPKLLLSRIDINNVNELTIYDPSCEEGDLLLECKKFINNINPDCNVVLMGCSILNSRSFSLCLSKMLLLNQDLNNFSYSKDFNSQFKSELFIKNEFDFIISDFGHLDYFLKEPSFKFHFTIKELYDKFNLKLAIIYSFSPLNNSFAFEYFDDKILESIIRLPISSEFGRDGILILNKSKIEKLKNKFLLIDEKENTPNFNLNNLPEQIMDNVLKCYTNFKEYDNGKIFDFSDIFDFFNFKELMYVNNNNIIDFGVPFYYLGQLVSFKGKNMAHNDRDDDLVIPSKSYGLEKNVYFKIDSDSYANYVSFNLDSKKTLSKKVLKDYLYYYLNSNRGTSDILYFIEGVDWITYEDLYYILIPVPTIEKQQEIINAARKMEGFFNAMDIWKNNYSNNILNYENTLRSYEDFACSIEFSDNGSIEMCPRWKIVYQGLIWPLAAAYLKATMGSDKEDTRKKNHLVFFEFMASFNVIVLISAIKNSSDNIENYDEILKKLWTLKKIKEDKSGNPIYDYKSWHMMSFGSWTTLYGNLFKIFRDYKFSTELDRDFFENLATKKYKELFNKLRVKERNSDSHGGFQDDIDVTIKLQELERYMDEDMFGILKSYSGLKLFYTIGPIDPVSPQKIEHTVIHLNGPCDPPHKGKITTNVQLNSKSLYLYDSINKRFLELDSDLIKFSLIPNSKKYGIYIYDKIDLNNNVALYKCYYDDEPLKIPLKTDEDTFLKVSEEFLNYALRI